MDEQEYMAQQIQNEQNKTDVGILQGTYQKDVESILSKHLEPKRILKELQMLLMGYQLDESTGNYEKVMVEVTDPDTGEIQLIEQGPLLNPTDVRLGIGYLRMYLNSNTNLSYIESMEQVNNIMWNVTLKLAQLLHPLKKITNPRSIAMIWGMLDTPIYFSVLRSYKKISLDAMSKMQHSVEHLNNNPTGQHQEKKKPFKMFGF